MNIIDIITLAGVVVAAAAAITATITTIRMARDQNELAFLRATLGDLNRAAERLQTVDEDGVIDVPGMLNSRLHTGTLVLATIAPWLTAKEESSLQGELDRFGRWRAYQASVRLGQVHPSGEEPPSNEDMFNTVVAWFARIYDVTRDTRRQVAAGLRESAPIEFQHATSQQ